MFKAGDEVRIKFDLETGNQYNGCFFVSQMEAYKGKIGTITTVLFENYQSRRYKLDIDNNIHYFSNDMLEPINDSYSTISYKVEDRVKIIDEIPEDLYCIDESMWLRLLGKSGKIIKNGETSYLISIPEVGVSFWFPPKYFKKESTSTSENPTEKVSKLIECVPEIELSYCEKQIYTI